MISFSSVVVLLAALAGQGQCWPAFNEFKTWVSFGDSYTQTGFNVSLAPPSPSNPMGNPPYPGWTSSNGPNWVGLLTTRYNASRLQTYNLAWGGATVDAALAKPYTPSVHSLTDQVQKDFLPHFPASRFPPRQTLYSVWIGINDVLGTAANDSAVNQIFGRALPAALDALVTRGGAKFIMLVDVPPLEAAPDTLKTPKDWQAKVVVAVKRWNERLAAESRALQARHKGVNVRVMSSHDVFAKIAKDPRSFKQTAGLKKLQGYCDKYQGGTPKPDTLAPECGAKANEYFWLNGLHPTTPVHDALAYQTARFLELSGIVSSALKNALGAKDLAVDIEQVLD